MGITLKDTCRIGLIADTHMPGSIQTLWPAVFEAFADVDCILHAGDLHTLDVVDALSTLAPTYVSRGNGDRGLEDPRVQPTWQLDLAGIRIGMIHHFPSPVRKSREQINRYVDRHFHERPAVLIYGHTHRESVHLIGDMLCINPGSPTLPRNQSLRHGTFGMLEITEGHLHSTIYQIDDRGNRVHDEIPPLKTRLANGDGLSSGSGSAEADGQPAPTNMR